LRDIAQRLIAFNHQITQFQLQPPPPPDPAPFVDVPVMGHTSFSGNPREINQFLYFIKDWLVEVESCFATGKNKINWVVRHFCNAKGTLAKVAPSYHWWIFFLKEKTQTQELPPHLASAKDPYVLPCLISIRSFLTKLEEVFADQTSGEEAKRALYSCKQGKKPLDVFNSHFSSLVYSVDLTEESRCDVYKWALNPRVLEIAIFKDSWNTATMLWEKIYLEVLVANILDKLNILRSNAPAPQPNIQQQQHQKISTDVPMDINAMSANSGFSFLAYQSLCVKKKLCQSCLKSYNVVHLTNRSFPNTEVQMKDNLAFFTKFSQQALPSSNIHNIGLDLMADSTSAQSWDTHTFTLFTGLMMQGCDSEGNPIVNGKSSFSLCPISVSYSLFASFSSCVVLPVRLSLPTSVTIPALALLDSGAAGSFIDKGFVEDNQLPLTKLPIPFAFRSFNGSPASSGDVTHFWCGTLMVTNSSRCSCSFSISLYVTSLSACNIILGLPWLKFHHSWVGGPLSQMLFSPLLHTSPSLPSLPLNSLSTNPLLPKELLSLPSTLCSFADVFTVTSSQTLPPV
jgi:hypothetical protein